MEPSGVLASQASKVMRRRWSLQTRPVPGSPEPPTPTELQHVLMQYTWSMQIETVDFTRRRKFGKLFWQGSQTPQTMFDMYSVFFLLALMRMQSL